MAKSVGSTGIYLLLSLVAMVACSRSDRPLTATEGFVPVQGTELFHRSIGKGEPILIVHGGPGLNQHYLVPWLDDLAQRYRLIYYDQRACGKSPADVTVADMSLAKQIDDIEQIRQHLDLGKVHLLGHSWGGFLAMNYAVRYPQQLRSLMLINSIGASSQTNAVADQALSQLMTPEDSIARSEIMQSADFKAGKSETVDALMRIGFKHQFADVSFMTDLDLGLTRDHLDRARLFQGLAGDLASYDLHPTLGGMNVSTLILYGKQDLLSETVGPSLRRAISEHKWVVMEDCGHFPFIERPEQFADEVGQFID